MRATTRAQRDALLEAVHRQILSRTTKTGVERTVDVAGPLADYLEQLQAERRADAFRRGGLMGGGVPVAPRGAHSGRCREAYCRIREAVPRTLKRVGLPGHFHLHSTSHTFCTLLFAAGVSPVYVQQQAATRT